MRPDKAILTALARQMYDDIRFNASNAPTMAVDEDTTRLFNILMRMTREAYPGLSVLEGFVEMIPRTIKYKDALIVAGQLHTILRYQTDDTVTQRGERTPTAVSHSGRGSSSSSTSLPKLGKPFSVKETDSTISGETSTARVATGADEFEEELYGPNRPRRLNADGTVPFSLDEDG